MYYIRKHLDQLYLVVDILCLIGALLVWQFNYDNAEVNYLIGLVLPSIIIIYGRLKTGSEHIGPIALMCILFASFNMPNGLESLPDNIGYLFGAGIIATLINPVKDFVTGFLSCFWVIYFYAFSQSSNEVFTADFPTSIQAFAASSEGISFISTEFWWFFVIAGFLYSFLRIYLYKQFGNDRYLIISGIVSLPILFGVFVFGGLVTGIHKSLNTYFNWFKTYVKWAKPYEEKNSQPASRVYFFRKAYIDLKDTYNNTFQSQVNISKRLSTDMAMNLRVFGWIINIYFSIILVTKVVTIMTFGMVWLFTLTFAHLMILIAISASMYVYLAVIWLIDNGYRKLNKVKTICPSCHQISQLPVYICSHCKERHTNLVPGQFGILKRTCNCGQKIPTSFISGRTRLEARCPKCNINIHSKESTPICIPIIGGPNVGKTCFMISGTKMLIEEVSPKKDWDIRFIDEFEQKNFETVSVNLQSGRLPAKTVNQHLTAFNFFISNKKWSTEKMIYFYDPAGEAFDELNTLKSHGFYEYNHGNIFMIDPFSIPVIAKQYEGKSGFYTTANPSAASLEDIFDRLMISFQEKYGIKVHQKIDKPIAFVINKVDAYDLDERIGHIAANKLMEQDPNIKSIEDAIHLLCCKLLAEAGMNSFLRKVDDKFKNYRFFASSSLSSTSSTSVANPITWVLSQSDKDLKVS